MRVKCAYQPTVHSKDACGEGRGYMDKNPL